MSRDVPVLARMTWQQAAESLANRPVGLVPVGAIEAHGPHLPLDTDVIIAEATAYAAGQRFMSEGVPAIVLPTIAYGVSFVGTSFAGTSPAAPGPFEAYVASVLTHLGRQGYRGIICCNAHLEPAHFQRLHFACRTAEAETGIPIRTPDQRIEHHAKLLNDEFRAGSRHAGGYETSIVLAVAPDAVNETMAATLPPVWIDLPARLSAGAKTFLDAGAALGYFGNPASATADEGKRLLEGLAEIVWRTWNDMAL